MIGFGWNSVKGGMQVMREDFLCQTHNFFFFFFRNWQTDKWLMMGGNSAINSLIPRDFNLQYHWCEEWVPKMIRSWDKPRLRPGSVIWTHLNERIWMAFDGLSKFRYHSPYSKILVAWWDTLRRWHVILILSSFPVDNLHIHEFMISSQE
jgi:hypothetical protein